MESTCEDFEFLRCQRVRRSAALGLALMPILALAGCSYALHPVTMPAQVSLRIVGPSPEAYRVRLRIGEPHEYRVPEEGRITLDVPAYRRDALLSC
jgi:hypothetical protein